MKEKLELEAQTVKKLIGNKRVSEVYRHSEKELCIEFSDGTRLFVDCTEARNLELSVTGCSDS
jgi:predicted Ser/Thr protein kinase